MTETVKKPAFLEGEFYVFECPHCNDLTTVHVSEVNCRIFRHGSYYVILPHLPLVNGKPQYMPTQPINPHTPKEQCDKLVAERKVLGCAKPFRFVYSPEGDYVEGCDYI